MEESDEKEVAHEEEEEREEAAAAQQEEVVEPSATAAEIFDDEKTVSTAPTQQDEKVNRTNKYELFEKLLSFIDTTEEINPVLSGYFCKLFQVLVGNKPREVFTYIYQHPQVIDNLVRHMYQKSITEVLIRVLNVSDNLFEDGYEANVDTIRQGFIYKIVEKLDPELQFEDHLNAQTLLSELVEYKQFYQELTSQRSI